MGLPGADRAGAVATCLKLVDAVLWTLQVCVALSSMSAGVSACKNMGGALRR